MKRFICLSELMGEEKRWLSALITKKRKLSHKKPSPILSNQLGDGTRLIEEVVQKVKNVMLSEAKHLLGQ